MRHALILTVSLTLGIQGAIARTFTVLNRCGCDTGGICGAIKLRANNNVVSGNFIGTDVTGATEMPNATPGVLISTGSNNLIGGTTAAARNLISGNSDGGIGNVAIFA